MWEMFLRGAVAGLLLFHLVHLLRPGLHGPVRLAVGAFTLSVLGYLFCSMPDGANARQLAGLHLPLLALCVSGAPLLWLAARALFRDDFSLTAPIAASIAAFALLGVAAHDSYPMLRGVHAAAMLCFAAAALWESIRGWQADLVEPRRVARRWVVLGIGVYAAVVLIVEAFVTQPIGRLLPTLHVAGIGLVALALAVAIARGSVAELLGPGKPAVEATALPSTPPRLDAKLLGRLTQAMTVERVYRREGLTLAALAQALDAGEAPVRALINQGLGYRNFNDFLHHYRLEEAAARLVAEDLPILTIALECGYGSIGPFNRTFRQRFGMTPTEYRAGARLAPDRRPPQPPAGHASLRATK